LLDHALTEYYRDGCYVTLRLTAGMYHHFHAPADCRIERIVHIWGDTWNVNPATLSRVERLFCRNERVIIPTRLDATGQLLTLVPVAAVLVAGIRLRFLDLVVNPRQSRDVSIPSNNRFRKGEEMGWFEHGSTIILLSPSSYLVSDGILPGKRIQMGQALMREKTNG